MAFTTLSGDYNPIHSDFDYTYTTFFGKPIYHGMFLCLLGLERWVRHKDLSGSNRLSSLKCTFLNHVHTDQKFEIIPGDLSFILKKNNVKCVECEFVMETTVPRKVSTRKVIQTKPKNPKLDELPKKIDYHMHIDIEELHTVFPVLSKFIDNLQLIQLINLSRFVGMISPGLNSIFSSFHISFGSQTKDFRRLVFTLDKVVKETREVEYAFTGYEIKGRICSFYRPEPVVSKSMKDIDIDKTQFDGEKVLVIGGSQGLGEAIAKIYCQGGAEVTITYNKSAKKAQEIREDSLNKIQIRHFDITKDIDLDDTYTSLFYMATPYITTNGGFDTLLFQKYYAYYVEGFLKVFFCLKSVRKVFYPSTTAVSLFPEYACRRKNYRSPLKTVSKYRV